MRIIEVLSIGSDVYYGTNEICFYFDAENPDTTTLLNAKGELDLIVKWYRWTHPSNDVVYWKYDGISFIDSSKYKSFNTNYEYVRVTYKRFTDYTKTIDRINKIKSLI